MKMGFDLSNYETVEQRLVRFWTQYPYARIDTCMMNYDGDSCVFRAELYMNREDVHPIAVGYAHEIRTDRGVNSTSFVENCETSAIGRAIANSPIADTGNNPRPSRQEMEKVARLGGNLAPTTDRPAGQPSTQVHTPSGAFATPKQLGYIKKLAKDAGMDDLRLLELIHRELNDDSAVLELLKSHEASRIIEVLK
jgi:hypothetical protein